MIFEVTWALKVCGEHQQGCRVCRTLAGQDTGGQGKMGKEIGMRQKVSSFFWTPLINVLYCELLITCYIS